MFKKLFAVSAALAFTLSGIAKDKEETAPSLKIGDPAPKLQCGKFIQGDAVKGFEKGKVYIVEFWATWCGPCRQSIPHLNEIWQKFKDKNVIVIGQNVWEKDDSGVGKFVTKMGDKMTYRVALDDKSKIEQGAMAKTWMEASGQDGIPAAFVVDQDGKIAWIGHPMDGLDVVVDAVVAGKFDIKKEAERRAAEAKGAENDAAPADVTLHVGNDAPKLQTGKFIQGDEVTRFETDKVYVVEFWATWCGPCRQTIPHLNEIWLKNKDKGLIVIGQNVSEEDDKSVEKFVKKMGDKMTYRVALDDKSKDEQGAMSKTWMEASGQGGIPCAFVVGKDGKIAWIGHPMQGLDKVVEGVLAGTFDAKKEEEKRIASEKAVEEASEKLGEAMDGKKWADALKIIDQMEKLLPPDEAIGLGFARFQILLEQKDPAGAQKILAEIGEKNKNDAEMLNNIAWTLVTTKDLPKPDLALAEKMATSANDLAKNENPAYIDTLARIVFMKGDKEKAIELQKKAIGLAEDDLKEDLKDTLDSYKKGVLPVVDQAEDEPAPAAEKPAGTL
jgi:thiol-disulfide isomerase/thioredoxin